MAVLYGVGVGPGDPELMTLKAVRTIKGCDVIAVPSQEITKSVAYNIAGMTVSEVVYSDLLNTSSASARTFISFMRPDFVKEKILLYNLLILRITSILKIMLVIDNPYGSR